MVTAEPGAAVVSSDTEQLILVDEDDNEIGQLSKGECHEGEGKLHRAFSVFLFNDQGNVLLQRRSDQKRLWPGYWSNACCSHPRSGETMEQAVERRVLQELGVSTRLTYLYKFIYSATFENRGSERELCWVWVGAANETDIAPNNNEIADWRFLAPGELDAELAAKPGHFTPWLKLEWTRFRTDYPEIFTG